MGHRTTVRSRAARIRRSGAFLTWPAGLRRSARLPRSVTGPGGFAVHFLFSPWLLVTVAIVAWVKFRPRRSRR